MQELYILLMLLSDAQKFVVNKFRVSKSETDHCLTMSIKHVSISNVPLPTFFDPVAVTPLRRQQSRSYSVGELFAGARHFPFSGLATTVSPDWLRFLILNSLFRRFWEQFGTRDLLSDWGENQGVKP